MKLKNGAQENSKHAVQWGGERNKMDAAIWGLVGTIVGALASIGTTWISSKNASNLHKHTSEQERKERERSFQRNTLLDLQDALSDVFRMMSRGHMEDFKDFKLNDTWGVNKRSEEVNEGELLANRKASILIERVSNDNLRVELKNIIFLTTKVSLSNNDNEANKRYIEANIAAQKVMENLGVILRGLY